MATFAQLTDDLLEQIIIRCDNLEVLSRVNKIFKSIAARPAVIAEWLFRRCDPSTVLYACMQTQSHELVSPQVFKLLARNSGADVHSGCEKALRRAVQLQRPDLVRCVALKKSCMPFETLKNSFVTCF